MSQTTVQAETKDQARWESSRNGRKNKVFIVSLNPLAGEYLRMVLDSGDSVEVCQELPDRPLATTETATFVFDRALIPLVECANRVRSVVPDARFIVVDRAKTPQSVVRMLLAGIHGFVEYGSVRTSLKNAVEAVARGELWVSVDVLNAYVAHTSRQQVRRQPALLTETPREAQILDLLEQRLSNKEIAKILKIQVSTVKYHVSNLLSKRQFGDRHGISADQALHPLWHQLLD